MILDRPPKGWKRPSMPVRVKLQVVLNQAGRCKASGERLERVENMHFDHRPALWERKFNTATNDTIPPANDPNAIEAITTAAHGVRTNGTKATTAGSDTHRRAKTRRLSGETPPRPKKRWPSKPFPKGRGFRKRADAWPVENRQ